MNVEGRYTVEDKGYDTPCWVWAESCDPDGYGRVWCRGRNYLGAHRVSYEQHVGTIPRGFQLDHLCRVRACINPAHLEPVTNGENARRGVCAKLDWTKVREIRASSEPLRPLAERYGVSVSLISKVRLGHMWAEGK